MGPRRQKKGPKRVDKILVNPFYGLIWAQERTKEGPKGDDWPLVNPIRGQVWAKKARWWLTRFWQALVGPDLAPKGHKEGPTRVDLMLVSPFSDPIWDTNGRANKARQ